MQGESLLSLIPTTMNHIWHQKHLKAYGFITGLCKGCVSDAVIAFDEGDKKENYT